MANTSRMSVSPRSSRRRRSTSTGGSSAEAPRLPPPPTSARRLAAALGNMHLSSDFRLANTSQMSLSPRSSHRRRSISIGGSSAEAPRLPPPRPPPRSVVRSARCLAAALGNMHLASDLHLQPANILEGGKLIVSDLFNNNPSGMTGPHLIIAPHMVLPIWQFEFWTWLPSFTTILYDGEPEQRKIIRERYFGDCKFNVLLTPYDVMITDKKFLSKFSWCYLIIDQGERQVSNRVCTHIDTTKKAYDYKCSFFVQNLV